MCGIIFVRGTNSELVKSMVEFQYHAQSVRGKNGFGFVYQKQDGSLRISRATTEKEALANLRKIDSSVILFHHRFPTSTKNVLLSTHPFKIKHGNKTYFFVHNGVLNNEKEIYKDHKARGLNYRSLEQDGTFNDSECLAHEFVLFVNGIIPEMRVRGTVAFVAIEADANLHGKHIYYFRNNGNPLMCYFDKNVDVISSEGGNIEMEKDKLFKTDFKTGEILKSEVLEISSYFNYKGSKWNSGVHEAFDDDYGYFDLNKKPKTQSLLLPDSTSKKPRVSELDHCLICFGKHMIFAGDGTCELCDQRMCFWCTSACVKKDWGDLKLCKPCAKVLLESDMKDLQTKPSVNLLPLKTTP